MSGLEQRPALLSHVTQHGRTTAPKSRYADSTARTFLRSCLFFSLFGKLQGSLLDRRKEILSVLSATAARSKMLLRVRVEPAVELAVHDEERTDDLFDDAIEIHLGEHLCELATAMAPCVVTRPGRRRPSSGRTLDTKSRSTRVRSSLVSSTTGSVRISDERRSPLRGEKRGNP